MVPMAQSYGTPVTEVGEIGPLEEHAFFGGEVFPSLLSHNFVDWPLISLVAHILTSRTQCKLKNNDNTCKHDGEQQRIQNASTSLGYTAGSFLCR